MMVFLVVYFEFLGKKCTDFKESSQKLKNAIYNCQILMKNTRFIEDKMKIRFRVPKGHL